MRITGIGDVIEEKNTPGKSEGKNEKDEHNSQQGTRNVKCPGNVQL